jgi:hypothetical protein
VYVYITELRGSWTGSGSVLDMTGFFIVALGNEGGVCVCCYAWLIRYTIDML